MPEEFKDQRDQIIAVLKKAAGNINIKNADERKQIQTRHAVLYSPEFKALWDRIKHKSIYRLNFNNEELIEDCTKALRDAPPILRTRIQWRKAGLAIGEGGVEPTELSGAATVVIDEKDIELPDIMTELQDRTQLTRRSIYKILVESGRLGDFSRNPQEFIDLASEAINKCKKLAIVDGIKYEKLGGDEYYAIEMFEEKELTGYLKNLLSAQKAVYEQVVFDFDVEKAFADQLEKNDAVKVYTKLPGWFTIPTPLGTYNPDWAVLIEKEGEERLYFVVETKKGLFAEGRRQDENAKIECGREHFATISDQSEPVNYVITDTIDGLLAV